MGDVIGLPDAVDKARIEAYLRRYEKAHPGLIKEIMQTVRQDFAEQGGRKALYGEVNKQARGRTLMELPADLGHWLESAYPLMFRHKKHTAWFLKNFPQFLIGEKY